MYQNKSSSIIINIITITKMMNTAIIDPTIAAILVDEVVSLGSDQTTQMQNYYIVTNYILYNICQ